MKNSIIPITAASAICAAVLVGCEWGGVHSGESWNDAYSWANFTGTYKLVSTIDSSSGGSSGGSSSSSSTSETKTVTTTNEYAVSKVFDFSEGVSTYSGLQTPIMPGKTSISFSGFDDTFTDNGDGSLNHASGSGNASGSVNYSAGSVSVSFAGARDPCKMTVRYTYYVVTTKSTTNGTTTTTTTGGGEDSTQTKSVPIIWLNLTQKGNLLTFQDNNGMIYSGKITGASCPKASEGGYIQAGHIRFAFEATSTSNGSIKLSGSISGDWSGSSSANTGTIANRTIDASYSNGRSVTQFQAVSGTTTVYAREITAVSGTTE